MRSRNSGVSGILDESMTICMRETTSKTEIDLVIDDGGDPHLRRVPRGGLPRRGLRRSLNRSLRPWGRCA